MSYHVLYDVDRERAERMARIAKKHGFYINLHPATIGDNSNILLDKSRFVFNVYRAPEWHIRLEAINNSKDPRPIEIVSTLQLLLLILEEQWNVNTHKK